MKLDDGDQYVNSYLGAFCSIFLLITVFLYSVKRTQVLFERNDVDVLQTVETNAFTDDYRFSSENGFNIAVAFSAYDDETEMILDKSYGEIMFKHYEWGLTSEGNSFSKRSKIETHPCSREELGLTTNSEDDRSQSNFFPII